MNYFKLFVSLLPIFEEVFKLIGAAQAAGTPAAQTHQTIVDHVAALPDKLR